MKERLSRAEIGKDAVQDVIDAAAGTVGQVASIITTAVKDVAGTVGGFATEVFEISDAARRAAVDQEDVPAAAPAEGLHPDPDAPGGHSAPAAAELHADPDAPAS